MALNKNTLKASLKGAMLNNITGATHSQQNEIDTLAGAFADAIDAFVRTLQITYTFGLADSSGAVSGTFGNTLS